jgi:type IV secretion system protein TrbL
VLALQIIVALLEFKIVTLGGFILLPFGIWNKSAFLAERPLGYVVSSGLKVLALAIVISGARTVFDQLQPSANPDIYEALSILVASILLAMLAMFIPNLASALVTGGPALGAGSAITAGIAVGGSAALAGAGIAGAGTAVAGGAAKMSGPARAAAGAGGGRSPTPPMSPPPSTPPKPSNDNPSPSGPRRPSGGAMSAAPSSSPGGVSEPAVVWQPRQASGSALGQAVGSGGAANDGAGDAARPGRPAEKIAAEAQSAKTDFHRAAARSAASGGSRPPARAQALQAFFVANAGRGLMPAGETSGVLSPNLRTEES